MPGKRRNLSIPAPTYFPSAPRSTRFIFKINAVYLVRPAALRSGRRARSLGATAAQLVLTYVEAAKDAGYWVAEHHTVGAQIGAGGMTQPNYVPLS